MTIKEYYLKMKNSIRNKLDDYILGINPHNIGKTSVISNFSDLTGKTLKYFGTGTSEVVSSSERPGIANNLLVFNDDVWKVELGNISESLTFFFNIFVNPNQNNVMPFTFNNGNNNVFNVYLNKKNLGINTWNSDLYGIDFSPYLGKYVTIAFRINSQNSIEMWLDGKKQKLSIKSSEKDTISYTKITKNMTLTVGAALNRDYLLGGNSQIGSIYIYDKFLEDEEIVLISKILKFGIEHPEDLRKFGKWNGEGKYLLLTPNGGLRYSFVVEDKNYNLWAVIGKFQKDAAERLKGSITTRRGLITTSSPETAVISCDWGSLEAKEQAFIATDDIENYSDSYYFDFGYGIPENRDWAHFWTSGNDSGMRKDPYNGNGWRWGFDVSYCFSIKWGWKNTNLKFMRMLDQNSHFDLSSNSFRNPGSILFWKNQNDAKFLATKLNVKTVGQDQDNAQVGFGFDDGNKKFFDISNGGNKIGNDDVKVNFDSNVFLLLR